MRDEVRAMQRICLEASAAITTTACVLNSKAHGAARERLTTASIPTGLKTLDIITGGLRRSGLVVLASPPGMGKTALALSIVGHVAVKAHIPTLYVTLQRSKAEIPQRLIHSGSRIADHTMQPESPLGDRWSCVRHTVQHLSESPLYVDDWHSRTVSGLYRTARQINEGLGNWSRLGLIVVDQVQVSQTECRVARRRGRIKAIINDLKVVAKSLDAAVLLLCQLDSHQVGSPAATSIKALVAEDGADMACLLHRGGRRAWLDVVQSQSSTVATLPLSWDPEYLHFTESGSLEDPWVKDEDDTF